MEPSEIITKTLKCTFQDLIKKKNTQEFLCKVAATDICGERQHLINFFKFYWCDLNSNIILLSLIYIFIIFLILKVTTLLVENYVAEVITNISEKLKLTPSFAAVTLLAFANGAGDLITALVASGAEGGLSYNIGALYGAGLFSCSFVIAICILQDKHPIVYDKVIIYRDILFYIFSTIATLLFAVYGKITWVSCVILLVIYVALVVVVKLQDIRMMKKKMERKKKKMLKSSLSSKSNDLSDKLVKKKKKIKLSETSDSDFDSISTYSKQSVNAGKAVGLAMLMYLKESFHSRREEEADEIELDLRGMILALKEASLRSKMRLKIKLAQEYHKIPFKKLSFWGKVNYILDFPAECILYFTALPTNEDSYSKLRCLIYTIPGTVFWYWVITQEINYSYFVYPVPIGFTLFLVFVFTLPSKTPPKFFMLLNIMSVVSGLMWSKILIRILIDLLNTVEVIMNVPKTFLGLTVLAIGNGMVDAITTISLCKSGAGTLAISGGYMGQLFGYLIGFGVSMLKLTLEKGPQEFDLFNKENIHRNLLCLLVIGATLLILFITFVWGVVRKQEYGKMFACVMMGSYVIFIGGCSVVAFHKVVTKK